MKPSMRSAPLSVGGRAGTYCVETRENDLSNFDCATGTYDSLKSDHVGRGVWMRRVVENQRTHVRGEGFARRGHLRWGSA